MWPLLVLAFILVPIAELAVILRVGDLIGLWPTVALLLVVSIAGATLFKREGLRAARNFRAALNAGRIPAGEVVDGALVVFGGALLLTPGFLTDIAGLAFVLPPSRALLNRLVRNRVRAYFGLGREARRPVSGRGRQRPQEDVVDVEVVDVERN